MLVHQKIIANQRNRDNSRACRATNTRKSNPSLSPSRDKRQYFIWCYPPSDLEHKSWKAATAWHSPNAQEYKMSGRLYSRYIFSEKLRIPRTKVDRFLLAVDHAVIDALRGNTRNREVLFGKWLIRVNEKQADAVWESLTQKIENGMIPYCGKISTARINTSLKDMPKNSRLICVYTPNFLWKEDVRKARRLLMESGFQSRLYYRPDLYTVLENGSVSGTDFRRSIFKHLRRYGVTRLVTRHRYFG